MLCHLLAEFSYNNSYHSSIRCDPFEALYGRKYRSPVLWAEIRESRLIGPELVQETIDKVVLIKEKLKAARDRQKRYADNTYKPLEFKVGDQVLLKVLPEELSSVHESFHVSNLKKCLADANLHVPLDEIKVDKTLRFVEEPIEIMDREVKCLKHGEHLEESEVRKIGDDAFRKRDHDEHQGDDGPPKGEKSAKRQTDIQRFKKYCKGSSFKNNKFKDPKRLHLTPIATNNNAGCMGYKIQ
ncbi:putative reverse transcriptase domain-containing protein [Tanacetum coccineum]